MTVAVQDPNDSGRDPNALARALLDGADDDLTYEEASKVVDCLHAIRRDAVGAAASSLYPEPLSAPPQDYGRIAQIDQLISRINQRNEREFTNAAYTAEIAKWEERIQTLVQEQDQRLLMNRETNSSFEASRREAWDQLIQRQRREIHEFLAGRPVARYRPTPDIIRLVDHERRSRLAGDFAAAIEAREAIDSIERFERQYQKLQVERGGVPGLSSLETRQARERKSFEDRWNRKKWLLSTEVGWYEYVNAKQRENAERRLTEVTGHGGRGEPHVPRSVLAAKKDRFTAQRLLKARALTKSRSSVRSGI